MFKKIGLIMNPDKAEAVDLTRVASDYLHNHGIDSVCLQDPECKREGTDLILTFGGDGTFLIGARMAMEYDVPLMGINLGTVGFLTEAEPDRLTEALDAILNNQYQIEERFLLKVKFTRTGEIFYALNDAVITRGRFARLIRVECKVNGEPFGVFTADGMIAATPTGSTGYSLSAGGPIVDPRMNCILLTPVCAHSLQRCPFVVSEKSVISMHLQAERKQTAELQIDGMDRGKLEAGDEIIASGCEKTIRLLRIHSFHFFTRLQQKLIEWGSNHE